MSDEEKKAIEILKKVKDEKPFVFWFKGECYNKTAIFDILLNLIEKQSKEIEHQIEKRANQRNELAILNAKQIEFNKLVNTVNSYKGQFRKQQKEIEELKEKNKTLKNLQNDTSRLYTEMIERKNYFERELQKLEDKIKAKIEEIDEVLKGQLIEKIRVYFEAQKEVLQSLLEKE